MPPTVSINLCCYNSKEFLKETLQSILAQTYKDWELIIINDGSTDSTESIIKEYISHGYPIIYCWQENHGLGYSRNEALKRSSGKYIAFIDHDDIWMPEKLEKQIPLFEKNHRVGIVYSDSIWFNESGKAKKFLGKKNLLKGQCFGKLLTNYLLTMSSTIIRKKAFDDLTEWFDPRFNVLEEADLFRRIAYSWELDYIDYPLAKWRVHSNSLTWKRYELFAKEGELMINKLSKLYSNFDTKFAKEKKSYLAILARRRAIVSWQRENKVLARKQLLPYLLVDKKNFVLFAMTIFPYWLYNKGYTLFRVMPEQNFGQRIARSNYHNVSTDSHEDPN